MSRVILRKFNPETDSGLIYSSWPKGVWHSPNGPINQVKTQWFTKFYQHVKHCLETGSVYIACMEDNPDFLLGYSVITGPLLEFVYVKKDFRNQGIATLLVKNKNVSKVKNLTKIGAAILAKHPELGEIEHGISRREVSQEVSP
jgi:hypothetical protein